MSAPICVVVIPAYNAASTVAETLLALQQASGLSNILKVVLLDDCSTDETLSIARTVWTSATQLETWANAAP